MKFRKLKFFLSGRTIFHIIGLIALTIVIFTMPYYIENNNIRFIMAVLIGIANGVFLTEIYFKISEMRKRIKLAKIAQKTYEDYLQWKESHPLIDDEYYFENVLKQKGEIFEDED